MTDGMLDLTLPAPSLSADGSPHGTHPLLRRHGPARRHVHELINFAGRPPATVVMSNGNGVDSAALQFRWLTDPTSRDFELDHLLVITAIICSWMQDAEIDQGLCVVDMSTTQSGSSKLTGQGHFGLFRR